MADTNKIEFDSWSLSLILNVGVRCGIVIAALVAFAILTTRVRTHIQLNQLKKRIAREKGVKSPVLVIGFFHPNCDAGAGGEKVLWQAVKALQNSKGAFGKKEPHVHIQVYSGSTMDTQEMIRTKVTERFGIEIDTENVDFVHLDQSSAKSLDPANYPVMTVVLQAVAFIRVSIHAASLQPCDIFVDSMGVGFGYPFVKILFGSSIYSYTHYPTMSTDMINDVESEKKQFNNKNTNLKQLKVLYYKMLIRFYQWCGTYADQVAANSSWTRTHMDNLWNKPKGQIETIYPPCDTRDYMQRISGDDKRRNLVISFA